MAKPTQRGKNKDSARRAKKKISVLNTESVDYIDYKDVNLLRRFMSDRAKIRARRVTGNNTQQQSDIAMAIKNAREMALLPYASRVTQQRGGKRGDRGDRGERGERADRPDRDSRSDEGVSYEGAEAVETVEVDEFVTELDGAVDEVVVEAAESGESGEEVSS
jgi:small subunit ribosomal protein S18